MNIPQCLELVSWEIIPWKHALKTGTGDPGITASRESDEPTQNRECVGSPSPSESGVQGASARCYTRYTVLSLLTLLVLLPP